MRFFFIICLFFFTFPLSAQYYDNFSDGNYTASPTWFIDNISPEMVAVDGEYAVSLMPNAYNFDMLQGDFRTVSLLTGSASWSCSVVVDIESVSRNSMQFHLLSSSLKFDTDRSLYIKFDFSTGSLSFCSSSKGAETVLATSQNNLFSAGENSIKCSVTALSDVWTIQCYSNSSLIWSQLLSYSVTFSSVTSGFRISHYPSSSSTYLLYEASCISLSSDGSGSDGDSDSDDNTSSGGGGSDSGSYSDLVRGELLFTEFMHDPTPSYGLPEVEWIEVYNNTDLPIDLYGCKIMINSNVGTFKSYILQPNSYVAACSSSAATQLADYADCVVVTSMPTLLNDGAQVVLYSAYGEVVTYVEYGSSWGDSSFKSDGGWSFERIDVTNPINNADSWHYSVADIGGTPSAPNSIELSLPDTLIPQIIAFSTPTTTTLNIHFNKEMMEEDFYSKLSISDNTIASVSLLEPERDILQITLSEEIDSINSSTLTIIDIACVSGWIMADTTLQIALPSQVGFMDIVINEIMFSVSGEQSKFVELYNNSDKYFDISDLMICEKNTDEELQSSQFVADEGYILSPYNYVVVAQSLSGLSTSQGINPTTLYCEASLSFLNATSDHLVLAKKSGEIIDETCYNTAWHHPLIADAHDVSLERIDPIASSTSSANWHSASQLAGYNTAGWQNSQSIEAVAAGDQTEQFWTESNRFSPNNDGYEDMYQLHYSLDKAGYVLTINIYTRAGVLVANACSNQILSQSGTWVWNGIVTSGGLVQSGLYVITIEAIHLDGDKIQKKMVLIAA
ncbi:MAG: lamin tail domain-containing protein [bacterium]